jgi:circadian clock protein KaiC
MNKKTRAAGITKLPTGIAGFDQITGGGLPANRTTLVLGGPGSGKTVFALQALVQGAKNGEAGIFVSFTAPPRQVVEDGGSFGWDLVELEKRKLIFLDARMRPGMVKMDHYDLTGMLAGLQAVAAELGARRVVFDSFEVLLTLLDHRLAELEEVFRLRDWLFDRNFTGIITANLDGLEGHSAQRRMLMQFIADCTVSLDFRLEERTAARRLRVVKYRGSGFVESAFPFIIGRSGIEVSVTQPRSAARRFGMPAELQPDIARAREELTARVQEMDRFLEMKQAELGFLMEQESRRSAAAGRVKNPATESDRPRQLG